MGMSVLQVPPVLPSLGADGVRGLDPAPSEAVIVAVIPAYNEERFIASVVIKTRRYASHVIVVDDGSSDNTADLAELAGAEVVRQPWLPAYLALLAEIRAGEPALTDGDYAQVHVASEQLGFVRRAGRDVALVVVNAGDSDVELTLTAGIPDGTVLTDRLDPTVTVTVQGGSVPLSLAPSSARILTVRSA
jgi:cellulose synthase/poly-beta-1,6-N-acetylglucosamine synthase-like glycosyltransferase